MLFYDLSVRQAVNSKAGAFRVPLPLPIALSSFHTLGLCWRAHGGMGVLAQDSVTTQLVKHGDAKECSPLPSAQKPLNLESLQPPCTAGNAMLLRGE